MSKVRKLLEMIDRRMNVLGGRITLKIASPSQRMTRGELLSYCEELEDIAYRDVAELRASAGLPVAERPARR